MHVEPTPSHEPSFGYQPALDGVRALAVAAVLGFHLGISWMSGGYLGVSVFFTLSGFLITSLLLAEHHRKGMVDLPGFYQRRARRLIPAGLLVLGLVCIAVGVGLLEAPTIFRRQVFAAMFQVLNWSLLFSNQSYADLFRAPSPIVHYWSLGIEEQFYLLWPLALVVILRLLHRWAIPHRLLLVVSGLWLVFAISAPLTAVLWSHDAAYYATWARASEVLAGAILAVVLRRRRMPDWMKWLVPVMLALMAVLVVVTPAGRGWAFDGWLPVFSIISLLLVAGLQVPSRFTHALSWRPLVWMGGISYGLYLFHWPLFLMIDGERTGLHGWSLDVVRLAATFALALASYHVLEHPIRLRRLLPSTRMLTATLATAVVVVGVLAVWVGQPAADEQVTAPTVITAAPTSAPSGSSPDDSSGAGVTDTVAPAPAVIAFFGDSVPAWLLRDGSVGYSRSDAVLVNGAIEGCDGAAAMPPRRAGNGQPLELPADCEEWTTWYPEILDGPAADAGGADVAVLMLGVEAILDHEIDGEWVGPCDTMDWYVKDVSARIDDLRDRGVEVVMALPARLGSKATFVAAPDHVTRMKCVRRALSALAERKDVPIVDMDPEMCPDDECDTLRERDGMHADPEVAPYVLDWLVGRVLEVRRS